jgi:hypothetical protein
MFFFNIQSVTEYGDITTFEKEDPEKYATWLRMANKRYKDELESGATLNDMYLDKACYLPEFSKIIHISYCTAERGDTDANIDRKLKSLKGENELDLIKNFINVLNEQHVIGNESKPRYVPILTGHNITAHDIPLFVKRMLKYRAELKEDMEYVIPLPIRHYLDAKPWDSNVLDTVLAWKFNGGEFISLNLVCDFLGLKKTEQLLPKEEINRLYWSDIEDDEGSIKQKIRLQSANFTNVAFQIIKELRVL